MSRKMPINVGSFARDRLREWVNSFDVVLTDCDGESNYFQFKNLRFIQSTIQPCFVIRNMI